MEKVSNGLPEHWRTAADARAMRNRGFFGKGDMQKEFEEASFALKPGEISQVIETASGLHVIERCVCHLRQRDGARKAQALSLSTPMLRNPAGMVSRVVPQTALRVRQVHASPFIVVLTASLSGSSNGTTRARPPPSSSQLSAAAIADIVRYDETSGRERGMKSDRGYGYIAPGRSLVADSGFAIPNNVR